MSGMKKWQPYRSLVDQDFEYKKKEEKIEKPLISNEKAEEINTILSFCVGNYYQITYYSEGEIITMEGEIKKVDEFNRLLMTSDGKKIKINDLLDLEMKERE